jgi:outer membrane protein OmpA-like peptidoglycan-associated protein
MSGLNVHRLSLTFALAAAIAASCQSCPAQDSTSKGSEPRIEAADCPSASFPQLAGSVVVSCQHGDSTAVTMPLAPDARGSAREKSVRGFYEYREYRIPRAEQAEHAFDDLLRLVPMGGFIVKYSASPSIITARNGDTWALINVNGDSYNLSVVREATEPWTPVKTAQEIAREMQARNRVDIYGIEFSAENQAIQEKQSPILDEVLKYLRQHNDLAVNIESHKVSANGSAQSDLEITTARAKAILAWLVAHGLSPTRLQPKPFGRAQPIAENDTPLEIAKNERIALAKSSR